MLDQVNVLFVYLMAAKIKFSRTTQNPFLQTNVHEQNGGLAFISGSLWLQLPETLTKEETLPWMIA